jgi:DNA-binding LacI/PurR family transcriptional regulator
MGTNSNNNTTLQDLAKLAGVSVSTVSRALNDEPVISAKTKQRIWALARDHDYPFRHYMPAGPIGAEGSIAIVTPGTRGRAVPLSHPFFLELIASIGEAARARDCDFLVSHTTPENYDDLVHAVTTSRASGVIFLGQSMLHEELNRLAGTTGRFAVWGAHLPGQKYCSIGSDNVLGGRRATLHLARLGRKRILFLGGNDPEALQRRRGYVEGIQESGLEKDPGLIAPVEFELEAAEATVARLLHRGVKFDGVVASSDLIALGAIRAVKRAGLSVPGDVSVVGYDDMLLSRLSTPTLSTIRQDTAEAGRLLVSRVLDYSPDHLPVYLPTDLIVRESCGG